MIAGNWASPIAVLGAGPHGRQLAALVSGAILYDDNLPGYQPLDQAPATYPTLIGAAWPRVRRQIAEGRNLWHNGIVIFPGARVGDGATLGVHTHVGWNAVVSHGVSVGDFVNICPGAVIAGEATIGDDVFIGANASIIHGGIKVGDGAIIGAGAVVTENVPAGMVYAGVPARYVRAA